MDNLYDRHAQTVSLEDRSWEQISVNIIMEEDELFSIPEADEEPYQRWFEEKEQRFIVKCFWMNVGIQKVPRGIDFHTRRRCLRSIPNQIWLHKFKKGDLSSKAFLNPGTILDFVRSLRHFYKNILLPTPG
jgi:hypothetical protein